MTVLSPPPPVTLESIQAFRDKVNLPSLVLSQLVALNSPITSAEVLKKIDNLKTRKSPGPDSLPNKYYKTFKSSLTSYQCHTFQSIVTSANPLKEML